jgi:ligand-binding sensor domain-containing protein
MNAYQQIMQLDAEIRVLEKQRVGDWQARIVELLERKAEIERSLETEKNYYVART